MNCYIYTEQDCALLRELTRPHVDLLVGRKKDADSKLMRQAVWEAVFTKYNEREHSNKRTLENLKRKWNDLRQRDTAAKNRTVMPKRVRRKPQRLRQTEACTPNDVGDLKPQAKNRQVKPKRLRQTKAMPNDVGDLGPQVQVARVAIVEKPVTRSTSESAQSKPATPIASNLHAVKNVVSTNQEISVIENETQRPSDKENALVRKLLLTQIKYHRRQIEIMEVEHKLKKEILEIKKKKLNSDSNADSDRCLQISISK